MEESQIKKKLLELIHLKTGWGNPLRPNCECEDLCILNNKEHPIENQTVDFKYIFDEDGFSQYDKTHVFEGVLTFKNGTFIIKDIEEVHAGIATNKIYNPKEKKIKKKKKIEFT